MIRTSLSRRARDLPSASAFACPPTGSDTRFAPGHMELGETPPAS